MTQIEKYLFAKFDSPLLENEFQHLHSQSPGQ